MIQIDELIKDAMHQKDRELLNVSPAYGNSKLLGSVIKGGYDGTYNSYRYGTIGSGVIRLDFGFNNFIYGQGQV